MSQAKIKCPYCGEEILAIAKKCRFCGEWLNKSGNSRNSFITFLFILGCILLIIYGFLKPELWFIFAPLILIWYIHSKTDFNRNLKLLLSALLLTIGVVLFWNFYFDAGKSQEAVNKPKNEQTQEINQAATSKKEEVKKAEMGEPFDVSVTSKTVKKVNGKYRYFLDIRNNDKKDFNGTVSITLFNNEQNSPLGGDAFKSTSPIKPNLGNSVYLDLNTGTPSVHGEYGVTKFKYEVKVDDEIANSGEGTITDRIEDLSEYDF